MLGAGFHLSNKLHRAQSHASQGRSINTKELHASPPSSSSNVERFLESVTPSVPAHYLPKVCFKDSKVNSYLFLYIKSLEPFRLYADDDD